MTNKTQKRYWCSWVCTAEDHRPLTFPPNRAILGWWKSGEDTEGNATLVAVAEASDPIDAARSVKEDWPEFEEWRFIERVEDDHKPGDRFPLSEWMAERL